MDQAPNMQTRLITINNLCTVLSIAIERHYSTPYCAELRDLIARLAGECAEYIKASEP